ncbi:MAG: CHAT domain-containing protein [Acidobacteria bacterium]|nr:CHAT domain-containing protein [Acidobacteriota bacterium]
MLLGPVAAQLGKKRLLIVSDGALQYVPFAALPRPPTAGAGPETEPGVPLMVGHEIVSLPSASTLAVLRRERAGRPPATRKVAVLADPVYDKEDTRIRPAVRPAAGTRKPEVREYSPIFDGKRSAREASLAETGWRFRRLPFTRREAEAILAMTSPGDGMKAVDFSASLATATSVALRQFRIVHFATHGFLNSEHPELSGLVLSLVDEQGAPQNGFLQLHKIYNLDLPAELVVLSGCQTALGKEIKGEGLVGLTRGFMYAGASRVMASLWQVEDRATAELMAHFYRGLLGRERLSPAAALRQAQIAMWKTKGWEAPYYWAAFTLQGEWK